MSLFSKILLLVLTSIMTVVLLYLSLVPTYVLQISVEPRFTKGIEMRRDKVIVIYSGKEPIYFDVAGFLDNPNTSKVSLSLRPPKQPKFNEKEIFNVSNGSFLGTVQLGSAQSPIISDENYTYTIDSGDDNSRLSEGSIQLQVKAVISGTSQLGMIIMSGIGLLASILQIIQLFTQRGEVAKLQEDSTKGS